MVSPDQTVPPFLKMKRRVPHERPVSENPDLTTWIRRDSRFQGSPPCRIRHRFEQPEPNRIFQVSADRTVFDALTREQLKLFSFKDMLQDIPIVPSRMRCPTS